MKVYSFGDGSRPSIMLLPGTCCNWKSNFEKVIPLLEDDCHVLCVSYDGFDETERTGFPTMLEETEKIAADIYARHTAVRLAAPLWDFWRQEKISIWTTEFWEAPI